MISIEIMDHKFEIPCEEEDKEKLTLAADLLVNKLNELDTLKGESKIIMVALNLCFDYINMKDDTLKYCSHLESKLAKILSS